MTGDMNGTLAELSVRECAEVLQTLENREVRIVPLAIRHEFTHLTKGVPLIRERKLQLRNDPARAKRREKLPVLQKHIVSAAASQFFETLLAGGIGRDPHGANFPVNARKLVPLLFAEQRTVRNDIEHQIGRALIVDKLKDIPRQPAREKLACGVDVEDPQLGKERQ